MPRPPLPIGSWASIWTQVVKTDDNGKAISHRAQANFRDHDGQVRRAASLRERLQRLFSPQAARLGTLHELTKLAPIAIIADALGYSTKTIERHARGAGTTYAAYVANRQ
jgi:hypothetical protein